MKQDRWYNKYDCLTKEGEKVFSDLIGIIRTYLSKYEGIKSYRDLYAMARDAGLGSVQAMVADFVNKRESKKRLKRTC